MVSGTGSNPAFGGGLRLRQCCLNLFLTYLVFKMVGVVIIVAIQDSRPPYMN